MHVQERPKFSPVDALQVPPMTEAKGKTEMLISWPSTEGMPQHRVSPKTMGDCFKKFIFVGGNEDDVQNI